MSSADFNPNDLSDDPDAVIFRKPPHLSVQPGILWIAMGVASLVASVVAAGGLVDLFAEGFTDAAFVWITVVFYAGVPATIVATLVWIGLAAAMKRQTYFLSLFAICFGVGLLEVVFFRTL
jgi:hypothetical protein